MASLKLIRLNDEQTEVPVMVKLYNYLVINESFIFILHSPFISASPYAHPYSSCRLPTAATLWSSSGGGVMVVVVWWW